MRLFLEAEVGAQTQRFNYSYILLKGTFKVRIFFFTVKQFKSDKMSFKKMGNNMNRLLKKLNLVMNM